ncbi:hypothetical protein [Agaribacter flavus]|uniref:Uncharacterized protein n=1 Tax=Agaribacter flavus TaxID=1902781 RepID=A0ABV7FTV7_9ALTE
MADPLHTACQYRFNCYEGKPHKTAAKAYQPLLGLNTGVLHLRAGRGQINTNTRHMKNHKKKIKVDPKSHKLSPKPSM